MKRDAGPLCLRPAFPSPHTCHVGISCSLKVHVGQLSCFCDHNDQGSSRTEIAGELCLF